MAHELKDGTTVEDPRLDRLIEFDERSREYPIRATLRGKPPRSYTWRVQAPFIIDQGQEGACVGFSVVNELQARPSEVTFDSLSEANSFARNGIYHPAQRIDPWPGGAYPGASPFYEGTSVLAGVKVAHSKGYFGEYRWSFGLEDFILGLGHNGPAIIGVWWYDTNYRPDAKGFISPTGNRVGGHAILARAVKIVWTESGKDVPRSERGLSDVDLDASYVTLRNSWGRWGYQGSGDCYVTLRNMGRWLGEQGEAVFFVNRKTVPAVTA